MEGDKVIVKRLFPVADLRNQNPFVLWDHFKVAAGSALLLTLTRIEPDEKQQEALIFSSENGCRIMICFGKLHGEPIFQRGTLVD